MPSWDKLKNEHYDFRFIKNHIGLHQKHDTNNWHCINPTNITWSDVQHFSSQNCCQCVLDKTLEKPNILFSVKRIGLF